MRPDRRQRQTLTDADPLRAQQGGTQASGRSEYLRDIILAIAIVGGLILTLIVLAAFSSGPAG